MEILNSILTWVMKKRIHDIELFMKYPHDVQRELLDGLIRKGANTEYGFKYGFSGIMNPEDFKRNVPIVSYEDIFPYIERLMQGEQNVLWPSEILSEILYCQEQYLTHDALFSVRALNGLVGEFVLREEALKSPSTNIPPLYISGNRQKISGEMENVRLVGLGSFVSESKGGYVLSGIVVDTDKGDVTLCRKTIAKPEDDSKTAAPFSRIAKVSMGKDITLHMAASGQLLVKKCKRYARDEIKFTRSPATVQPQAYQWEKLPSQILIENYGELAAQISSGYPGSLMPRRISRGIYAIKVAKVEMVNFSTSEQTLYITISDEAGDQIKVIHPFHKLAASGFEKLLH